MLPLYPGSAPAPSRAAILIDQAAEKISHAGRNGRGNLGG